MISLLALGLLFQIKPVPPPVKPCIHAGKSSSIDSRGNVTTSEECFDDLITTRVISHPQWTAVFSSDMKSVLVSDEKKELNCKAFEIQDHQGFMYVCTTVK